VEKSTTKVELCLLESIALQSTPPAFPNQWHYPSAAHLPCISQNEIKFHKL